MSGEVIGGYRLQTHLMTGQSSQVWEVVELSSGRHFAMKIMLPESAKDDDKKKQFLHEADVGIKLRHPNVIKIMHVERKHETPFFVMEFFPSGALKLRLVRKQFDFIKEHALSIFKQAATALAYMNTSGWVHRDVKPDNILVNSAGEVRLIDFALAQKVSRGGIFARLFGGAPKAMGTRSYMSPEQIRRQPLDGRADIYSFGASIYEVTTGRPPFRGASNQDLLQKQIREIPSSPQMYNKELTDEFSELVLKMLAKKREDRPRDFHEVLMKLKTMKIYKTEAPKPEKK